MSAGIGYRTKLNMRWQAIVTLFLLYLFAGTGNSTEILSEFESKKATLKKWSYCQADDTRLKYESGGGRTFLRNKIDGSLGNTDICSDSCTVSVSDLEKNDLRQSLLFDPGRQETANCPKPEKDSNGKVLHQRNELRPQIVAGGCHAADAAHWYSMKFKVEEKPGDAIPTCGSIRWVTAQWKYATVQAKNGKAINDSPFLAQRFDNGVLHITVEDGFCRCMIAKADGDPYKTTVRHSALAPVKPLRCEDRNSQTCNPPHLELFAASQDVLGQLPDPKEDWVEMTYFVSADAKLGTRFDIYANGRFIVRALGAWSGNIEFPNMIKFKFGHYRDKFQNKADLLVDRVCVSTKFETCAAGLTRQP